jgi:phosphoglycerate dehydrogenase-like enzyme
MRAPGGGFRFDVDLTPFETGGIEWEFLPEHGEELAPEHIAGFDALFVFGARVPATTIANADRLALIVRFGVGLDTVDVEACTRHGIYVATTPDGVRRPVATAAVAMLLALAFRLLDKDAAAREHGWPRRFATVGVGLSGKSVGLIGYGNVGREIALLLEPFKTRRIAHSPTLTSARAGADGVEAVSLEQLLRKADAVVVACPLTADTWHLLNADRIALLKPGALVVNVGRGGVVDQRALAAALRQGRLGGAALDVFEPEPISSSDPILTAPNVLLAPHAAAYVDELFRGCVASAATAVRAVAAGGTPEHVVNCAVVEEAALLPKLARR